MGVVGVRGDKSYPRARRWQDSCHALCHLHEEECEISPRTPSSPAPGKVRVRQADWNKGESDDYE